MEVIRIRADHEWATIALQGWRSGLGHEQGELMIHSSFGVWAHQWGNLGMPLHRYLATAPRERLMEKLLGVHAVEFDYDASLENWRRHLVTARRKREITRDEFQRAAEITCESGRCGLELFVWRIQWADPGDDGGRKDISLWHDVERYVVCRDNQQFSAFWRELWPLFLQQLRPEAANESMAAAG